MEIYLQHRDAYHDKREKETDTDSHALSYANGQDSRQTVNLSPDCARGHAVKPGGWRLRSNKNHP